MPLHDFYCETCQEVTEHVVPVDTRTVTCASCGEPSTKVYLSPPKAFSTIIPDYPGSKKRKAGYIHSHGDKPATKVMGRGFSPDK